MLRKLFLVLILGINSTAALAISNAELFAYAQANYPSIFSGNASAGTYLQYTYQYYQGSGTYLAVDNNDKIFMKGPFTHDAISEVGALADYQNAFRRFINQVGPQGPAGNDGAEVQQVHKVHKVNRCTRSTGPQGATRCYEVLTVQQVLTGANRYCNGTTGPGNAAGDMQYWDEERLG